MLAALPACDSASEPVTKDEVLGSWIASGPGGRTGTLVFKDDGSFEGRDLPDRVFYSTFDAKHGGPPDWEATDRISGVWSVDWDGATSLASVFIDIQGRFDHARIDVVGQGPTKHMSYSYSDPDNAENLEFAKLQPAQTHRDEAAAVAQKYWPEGARR